MATAIGSYCTTALVKARLSGTFDSADDTLIGTLCDQVNAYIEGYCGRVIAPRPVGGGVASDNEVQSVTITGTPGGGTFALTFNGSTTENIAYDADAAAVESALEALATIGTGNVVVTGTNPSFSVEFDGDLAGLAQSLMTATDALTGGTSPGVTVALVSTPQTALWYFDGDGSRVLWVDVRGVEEVAVATQTGATYTVLDAADYFLRPLPQDREPGWPATRIELSDYPVSGYWVFPQGYATVRLKAVIGWPAIPDDLTDVACTMAVNLWHRRQSGQADVVGNDETGAPVISRMISLRDRDTLKRYAVPKPVR